MARQHEMMTDEKKKESLEDAIKTVRFLVESGFQGNITLPVYDRAVGKIKSELFMEPSLVPGLLKAKVV